MFAFHFPGLVYMSWLYLSLRCFCSAFSDNVDTKSSSSNDTVTSLHGSSGGYNGTTNLTVQIPFHFDENPFKYIGSIDTSKTFTRGEFENIGTALEACWQQISRYYPAPDSMAIPGGTNAVFYLDEWQFRFKWSATASPSPVWTRAVFDQAAKNLKTYFQNGEGRANNRHPMRVTTRFLTQTSIWSLEVLQASATQFSLRSGMYNIHGSVYSRDSLPANVCSTLFDTAIAWAKSSGLSSRIPDGTWRTMVANDVSLRLYFGSTSGKPASAVKYRDLVKMLQAYRSHVTGPGKPGWTGSLIFLGPVGKYPGGVLELAPGTLPASPVAAGVQQEATY